MLNDPGLVPVTPVTTTKLGSDGTILSDGRGKITFSGIVGFQLDNLFNSSYKHYKLDMHLTDYVGGTEGLYLRYRTGTTTEMGAAYDSGGAAQYVGGTTKNINIVGSTGHTICGVASFTKQYPIEIDIYDPISATYTRSFFKYIGMDAFQHYNAQAMGIHGSSKSIHGVEIYVLGASRITGTLSVFAYN